MTESDMVRFRQLAKMCKTSRLDLSTALNVLTKQGCDILSATQIVNEVYKL